MFLAAGEHQWRPARADNFENIGNDLTIAVCVGYERSIRVVNRELGGVCRRTETGISRHRQVPKRRASSGIARAEIETDRAALHEYDRVVAVLAGTHHYAIFGDMNQQGAISGNCASSQNGWGGLFYVIDDQELARSVGQLIGLPAPKPQRSEERRVGKECR